MKRILLLLVLMPVMAFCHYGPGTEWYLYKSDSGHFSIRYPAKPDESSEVQKADNGTPFTIHYATYSVSDDEVLMAGWIDMTDFYPANTELKQMLENSRDGAVASMKAKNVQTLTTNLGENPYIEFTFASDDFVGKDRIYIINKFQYSIITIFSAKTGLPPMADTFIRSFRYKGK